MCKNAIKHAFKRCQTLLNAFEYCWLLLNAFERFQTPSNITKFSRNAKLYKNASNTLSNATKHYWTLLNIADCYLTAFERYQTSSNITKLSRNAKLCKNAIEHAFKRCQMLLNTFEHCWLLLKRYQTFLNSIKHLSFREMLNCVKMLSNTLSNPAKCY